MLYVVHVAYNKIYVQSFQRYRNLFTGEWVDI